MNEQHLMAARSALEEARALLPRIGRDTVREEMALHLDAIALAILPPKDTTTYVEVTPGMHPHVIRLIKSNMPEVKIRLVLYTDMMTRNEFKTEVIDPSTYPHSLRSIFLADEIVRREEDPEEGESILKSVSGGREIGRRRRTSSGLDGYTVFASIIEGGVSALDPAKTIQRLELRTRAKAINNFLYRGPSNWSELNAFVEETYGMRLGDAALDRVASVVGQLPLPAED